VESEKEFFVADDFVFPLGTVDGLEGVEDLRAIDRTGENGKHMVSAKMPRSASLKRVGWQVDSFHYSSWRRPCFSIR
jgi:hypothetical protein